MVQTDKWRDKRPVLSFILCSRNDDYCGDPVGRLTTTLNYLGEIVQDHGLDGIVEVILSDWGSEVPLKEVLKLNPSIKRILKFLTVPPEVAAQVQKDSPFSEVHALNAAARRASGLLIGRIDQDTLVGDKFFAFLKENLSEIRAEPNKNYYWCGRRDIPPEDYAECRADPLKYVRKNAGKVSFWRGKAPSPRHQHIGRGAVGIFAISRAVYSNLGGYDEKNIYFNHMEFEFVARLWKICKGQNLCGVLGVDFYHIFHEKIKRKSNVHEFPKFGNFNVWSEKITLRPNGPNWGLGNFNLKVEPAEGLCVFGHRLW